MLLRDEGAGSLDEAAVAVDPVWLSQTIGAIYDCALDPSRWQPVLGAILTRLAFVSGGLYIMQWGTHVHRIVVNHGIDEERLALPQRYMDEAVEGWGGPARVASFPIGEPIIASEVRPLEQWSHLAYYREILEPRKMIDAVGVALVRDQSAIGYLALDRNATNGPVRPGDVGVLRLLAPHLQRAVTISNLFDLKAVEAATFQSVLDAMATAVVLVDAELRIVHANRSAVGMLDQRDLMHAIDGKLSVRGRVAGEALRAAVAIAARDEANMAQRGIGIPAVGKSGEPAALHVLPLERRLVRPHIATRAVAAVFVATGTAHSPVDLVGALHGLTPAETLVLAALCKGETLASAADGSGITMNTAKTHLKRVFSKTGCSRQAELVALVAKYSVGI